MARAASRAAARARCSACPCRRASPSCCSGACIRATPRTPRTCGSSPGPSCGGSSTPRVRGRRAGRAATSAPRCLGLPRAASLAVRPRGRDPGQPVGRPRASTPAGARSSSSGSTALVERAGQPRLAQELVRLLPPAMTPRRHLQPVPERARAAARSTSTRSSRKRCGRPARRSRCFTPPRRMPSRWRALNVQVEPDAFRWQRGRRAQRDAAHPRARPASSPSPTTSRRSRSLGAQR